MKKFFLINMILLQLVVRGQSQNNQQILESSFRDTCIYYVEPSDRSRFIENYKNEYIIKDPSLHTNYIDFPASYIKFMANFYNDNPKYTGLRINMGNFYRSPHNKGKKQIMLMFSPTINKIADSIAFKNYRKQRLKKQEYKKIEIDPIYAGKKKKNKHFITHGSHKFNKYKKAYKKNFPDSCNYSTSLFLCSDNIKLLNKLFTDNPEYDKIRFEFISYNEIKLEKQCSPTQISLLLTPVKNGIPDPLVLKNFITKALNNGLLNKILSVNHGELCPFKCN